MMTPIQRKVETTTTVSLGQQPCGGVPNGFVHYHSMPGSRNLVGWKVEYPSLTGNCTVRIGDVPDESKLQVLYPLDGSANDKGSFPCGRSTTELEAKEFRFPHGISCDQCILQVEWKTEAGEQHRCADIEVLDKEMPECYGQCLNGGICQNGKCACMTGFSGANC